MDELNSKQTANVSGGTSILNKQSLRLNRGSIVIRPRDKGYTLPVPMPIPVLER